MFRYKSAEIEAAATRFCFIPMLSSSVLCKLQAEPAALHKQTHDGFDSMTPALMQYSDSIITFNTHSLTKMMWLYQKHTQSNDTFKIIKFKLTYIGNGRPLLLHQSTPGPVEKVKRTVYFQKFFLLTLQKSYY